MVELISGMGYEQFGVLVFFVLLSLILFFISNKKSGGEVIHSFHLEDREREPWMDKYLHQSNVLYTPAEYEYLYYYSRDKCRVYTFEDGVKYCYPEESGLGFLLFPEDLLVQEDRIRHDRSRTTIDGAKVNHSNIYGPIDKWFLKRMLVISTNTPFEKDFKPCKNDTSMYNHRGYKLPKEY